jgi:Asp-tRNA(Asn)/Glu-tRNA(Gln) amidotransferase A subunit family amidase
VRRSSWHRTLLSIFERFDLVALPTAQVFPFDVTTHWPREVAGRTMDSYHRWMQVSAFATLGGCPAVNVSNPPRTTRAEPWHVIDRAAARRPRGAAAAQQR